jgi:cell division protein FtsB
MDFRIGIPKLRILPAPEQRLRAMEKGAEYAETWAGKLWSKAEPAVRKLYVLRRRLATVSICILAVWLFAHVMFGANGMVIYKSKRAEYQDLQKQIVNLRQENAQYSEQVKQLKTDPQRIEKEAREQFHYARPGEVIYVSPEPAPPAAAPVSHSASK